MVIRRENFGRLGTEALTADDAVPVCAVRSLLRAASSALASCIVGGQVGNHPGQAVH